MKKIYPSKLEADKGFYCDTSTCFWSKNNMLYNSIGRDF